MNMKYVKIYITRQEKLQMLLIGLIVSLLILYILSLNFALSETFRKGEMERDLKILRQDLQKNEVSLALKLSEFYANYSSFFAEAGTSRQEFVSRNQNFAEARGPNFR